MHIIKQRLRLRCNLISIMDHIRFILFRIRSYETHRLPYMHGWMRFQLFYYYILWMFVPCFVYCYNLSVFGVLPSSNRRTYSNLFPLTFSHCTDWLAMDEMAQNSHLIWSVFTLPLWMFCIENRHSFHIKKIRTNFCVFIVIATMRKNMQKSMIVSNLFNNFAFFSFCLVRRRL